MNYHYKIPVFNFNRTSTCMHAFFSPVPPCIYFFDLDKDLPDTFLDSGEDCDNVIINIVFMQLVTPTSKILGKLLQTSKR